MPVLVSAPASFPAFVQLLIAPAMPAYGEFRIEVSPADTAIKVEWPSMHPAIVPLVCVTGCDNLGRRLVALKSAIGDAGSYGH